MAGTVSDPGKSTSWKAGDRVMSVGLVGRSDSCSYQSYALVDDQIAIKVRPPAHALGVLRRTPVKLAILLICVVADSRWNVIR